ncbi:unnamed protein product [Rotaria sp. Silwood1]|nr:unnamed protein product [Rotaria sp. Silwood1]
MYPADVSQTTQDSPAQPHLAAYPTGKENRSFQEKWYVDRPWLDTPTRIQRDSFTVGGFNNWKRALARDRGFDRHVKSQTHIISSANFFEYQSRQKSNTTVIHVLEKSRADQIRNNRNKLINISSAILLCAKQLLALHGHDESIDSHNHGNLIEILKWSAQTDPLAKAVLKESAGNATYLSHQIQDELLHIMANQIRDSIAEKLHGNVYGLLADEATDVSHNKQLSICLRLVDDQYEIKEFFLGFIRLYLFDADTLAKEITVLQELQDLIDDGGGRAVDARVCTDLDSAQNLITTISERLKLMRDENSFKDLFHRAITFGNENDVNMNGSIRMRRQKTISTRFKNCVVTSSVGHRDYNTSEENFRVTMYFPTIDSILIELNERFSCHNLQIANSISSLSPMNEKFLDTEMLQPLIDHLRLEKNMIINEISVIKPMIKNTKLSTTLDLLNELKSMEQAFPSAVVLIKGAVTFPVSSVACERSFSKMKLIKNYARNSMSDERLSDLSVLAIEKEFEIDIEKVVDVFAKKHKK